MFTCKLILFVMMSMGARLSITVAQVVKDSTDMCECWRLELKYLVEEKKGHLLTQKNYYDNVGCES